MQDGACILVHIPLKVINQANPSPLYPSFLTLPPLRKHQQHCHPSPPQPPLPSTCRICLSTSATQSRSVPARSGCASRHRVTALTVPSACSYTPMGNSCEPPKKSLPSESTPPRSQSKRRNFVLWKRRLGGIRRPRQLQGVVHVVRDAVSGLHVRLDDALKGLLDLVRLGAIGHVRVWGWSGQNCSWGREDREHTGIGRALGPDGDCAAGPEKLSGLRPELLHVEPVRLERRERSVDMQYVDLEGLHQTLTLHQSLTPWYPCSPFDAVSVLLWCF